MQSIPFGKPLIDEAEKEAVNSVLSGTMLVHGEWTQNFESEFAARVGVEHAVAVSSCTAGLHLSLRAHEIGPGDSVIVPAMTHVATAHAAEYCGANVVFVDVEEDTGNLNPVLLKEVVSQQEAIRAIIPVHYLGLPCDMNEIIQVGRSDDTLIIEDCALAIDATLDGSKVGSLGDTGCFSFYPVKHMTSIEGGMVTTNNAALADKIKNLRTFGYDRALGERSEPGIYDIKSLGMNFRMNEVQAAIGLTQLRKLNGFQEARAKNFNALATAIADIEELTVFPSKKGEAVSSHYCLNVTLPKDMSIVRSRVTRYLLEHDIGFSVHYPVALPMSLYYREKYGYCAGQFPVSEWIASQTISLPVGPHLADEDVIRIASTLKEAIAAAKS